MLPNRPSPFPTEASLNQFNYEKEYTYNNENIIKEYQSKYKNLNSSKEFLRTTITTFPRYESQLSQLKIPIGINISPSSFYTKTDDIPLIKYGEINDVPRCSNSSCKAFFNPFIKFIDDERWECNICKNENKIEEYYYRNEKEKENMVELNYGTYEFLLNKSYWKDGRQPNKLNFYFLIDISYQAAKSGFAQCALESIKDCITNNYFYNADNFPIKICIITYDTSIQFYSINEKSNQFTMLNIADEKEIFIPTSRNNLLVSLAQNKNKLIQIIESIQNYIYNNIANNAEIKKKYATKIFDAIKAVNLVGGNLGGKILIFSGCDFKYIEMMNDKKSEDDDYDDEEEDKKDYNRLLERGGKKISKLGIDSTYNNFSINVFQACDEYCKLVTINQLCDNSNGSLFFYKNFDSNIHYKNLYNQIKRFLTNETQLESTFKLRLSNNFYIKEYITSVLLYNKKIFVFPSHDIDQKYSVLLSMFSSQEQIERNLPKKIDNYFYIQSCLLYSHGDGTRRMRVHNFCFPISSNNKDIFDSIDPEFLACFFAQEASHYIYKNRNLEKSMIMVEKEFYGMMEEFYNNLNYIKIELNNEMRTLILLFLGVMKLCLFNKKKDSGFRNDIDLSNFFRLKLLRFPVDEIINFIYPRIYLLDDIIKLQENDFPQVVNDSLEGINQGNLFLVDNGFYLAIYCKKNIENNLLKELFGIDEFNKINFFDINENNVFEGDKNGKYIIRIKELIDSIRYTKSFFQNLYFVFEGINDENFFKEILIEENNNKAFPYDFNHFYEKIVGRNYK